MITKVVAKAIVFGSDGQVLLLRRSQTDTNRPLQPDFPGGGVDLGEDVSAGVAREIQEEAGITVDPADLRLCYAHTETKHDQNILRLVYWCRLAETPTVTLSFEHDEYHWATPEQAYTEFPHPVYGEALRRGLELNLFDVTNYAA